MTGDPFATVDEWERQLRAKQPPDALRVFLRREYPGAFREAEGHAVSLVVSNLHRSYRGSQLLTANCLFTLYFSWSRGLDHATWQGEAVLGPGGLRRLSNRPAALRQVLHDEAPVLTPRDAEPLAQLLATALVAEAPPDRGSMARWQRDARMRSSVATQQRLAGLDSDPRSPLLPADREAWAQARQQIAPPSLELIPGGGLVTFWYLDATTTPVADGKGALFRALRFRCAVAAGSYEIREQCDDFGTVALLTPAQLVPGRPLIVDGAPRQAGLLRRPH